MNTFTYNTIFDKAHSPYIQGATVLATIFVVMLLAKVMSWTGLLSLKAIFPWTISTAFILFFAVFNSVFSLASKDMDNYWKKSIMVFVGVALISALLAYLFSAVPIQEAKEYRWIFMVFTFGYLVFISILGFMRRIVDFAQNEEWTKPRRKPRRR